MIKFKDGMEFNTEAKLHIEERADGYYVVGGGWLIPVSGMIEGTKIIGIIGEKSHE